VRSDAPGARAINAVVAGHVFTVHSPFDAENACSGFGWYGSPTWISEVSTAIFEATYDANAPAPGFGRAGG
jgi:hypothetical protein